MTVPALAAAKRLCEQSGWSISNLELQKILYIAHMFYLGKHGAPLVLGHFEAWDYGPVHPTVYHKAKIFGSEPVENIFHAVGSIAESEVVATLDEAVKVLSDHRPGRLVAITHWDRGAWAKHYLPGERGCVIPNEDILREYQDRTDAVRQKKAG